MYLSEDKSEMFVELLIAEVNRLKSKVSQFEIGYDTVAAETNPAPRPQQPKNPYNRGLSSLLQGEPLDSGFTPRREQ